MQSSLRSIARADDDLCGQSDGRFERDRCTLLELVVVNHDIAVLALCAGELRACGELYSHCVPEIPIAEPEEAKVRRRLRRVRSIVPAAYARRDDRRDKEQAACAHRS